MTEMMDALDAEFFDVTGRVPADAFAEPKSEPRLTMVPDAPDSNLDIEEIRKTWGTGPQAQAELENALRVAKRSRKR